MTLDWTLEQGAGYLGGKMTPRTYTRELYNKLLEGYRGAPGVHTKAARYAGVGWRTAKRAYTQGWPQVAWGKAIELVLREEGDQAKVIAMERARRERELQDADAEKARRARLEQVAEEEIIARALRKDVQNAAILVSSLTPAMQGYTRIIFQEVLEPEPDGSYNLNRPRFKQSPGVSAVAAIRAIEAFTRMASRVSQAGELVIQLGRTERGEANMNVAVDNMSAESAVEELQLAESTHKRWLNRDIDPDAEPDDEVEDENDGAVH